MGKLFSPPGNAPARIRGLTHLLPPRRRREGGRGVKYGRWNPRPPVRSMRRPSSTTNGAWYRCSLHVVYTILRQGKTLPWLDLTADYFQYERAVSLLCRRNFCGSFLLLMPNWGSFHARNIFIHCDIAFYEVCLHESSS